MDIYNLPTITMVAGSTHPVSFRVSDYTHSAVFGNDITGYLSVSHYINESASPIFSLTKAVVDATGFLNFTIPAENTVNLAGKYIYQVHITDGSEHEVYQGYMVIIANRNKSVF